MAKSSTNVKSSQLAEKDWRKGMLPIPNTYTTSKKVGKLCSKINQTLLPSLTDMPISKEHTFSLAEQRKDLYALS